MIQLQTIKLKKRDIVAVFYPDNPYYAMYSNESFLILQVSMPAHLSVVNSGNGPGSVSLN